MWEKRYESGAETIWGNNSGPIEYLVSAAIIEPYKAPPRWRVIVMWGWTHLAKKGRAPLTIKGLFFKEAKKAEEAPEAAIPVRTRKAVKTDYKDFITSFGTIKGFKEIPVKFEESVRIDKLIQALKPGWRVSRNGNQYYETRRNRSDKRKYL